MNLEKSFPYTEDMIKSENLFLNHLNDFVSNPKLKQFPEKKFKIGNFVSLNYGMNKGEKVPIELKNRLEKNIDLEILNLDLNNIDYKTDVVIIGTGGAGLSAAIEAAENGANVLILTKDKLLL